MDKYQSGWGSNSNIRAQAVYPELSALQGSPLPAWSVAAPAPHLCTLLQVKKAGSRVVFLLVDKETAKCHSEQKTQFKRETASLNLLPHQPRVVVIKKGSNGYGFYLRASPEQKGETQDSRPRVPESLILSAGSSSSSPTGELLVRVCGGGVAGRAPLSRVA